jgi:hypothetical protein
MRSETPYAKKATPAVRSSLGECIYARIASAGFEANCASEGMSTQERPLVARRVIGGNAAPSGRTLT